jgi:uridine kinase
MKIIHFSELNEMAKNESDFIRICDENYDKKCENIAAHIAGHLGDRPIILLSGPSGSGKTTTAMKIESCLDKLGLKTHTVSMDNYFLSHDKVEVFDENNNIDFESPYRIDIPLLQEHMLKLANCEEVDVPCFDFKTQCRISGRKLKRNDGELILFEGIHALNPEVTGYDNFASCVYVSVRTRIQLPDGSLLHPELIRLMRRIIRDRNFRNRSPEETMDMFDSVQRGENLYINPYKQRAHYELDTFLSYEPCVYKNEILNDFRRLENTYRDYKRYAQCAELLENISDVSPQLLSPHSLVREFVGGSAYEY